MKRTFAIAALAAAVAALVMRRRQAQTDAAALWHEATADAAH